MYEYIQNILKKNIMIIAYFRLITIIQLPILNLIISSVKDGKL